MTPTSNETRHCTHVGEWAELIGDDVPEEALDERLLRWPGSGDAENDCERDGSSDWPGATEAS